MTSIILFCSNTEARFAEVVPGEKHLVWEAINSVNTWLLSQGDELLIEATNHVQSRFQAWAFVVGAEHLDLAGLVEAIRAAPWRKPEAVQVFYKEETEDRFRMLSLSR